MGTPPWSDASKVRAKRMRTRCASSLNRTLVPTLLASVLPFLWLVPDASAQTRSLAEIAAYQGPDRTERLIAGAQREGVVSLYTSLVAEDATPVIEAFKAKYHVDVQVWRASTEAIVQRALAESRAGRCPADAFHSGPPALEPLRREKLLQVVQSPLAADVMPQARPAHREYVGVYLDLFAASYNTDLVKPVEAPASYQDLTNERWKGRLAVEADDVPWFAALVGRLGEDTGLRLFKQIVQANGMSARKGHTLLANMVAAGDVPLALTVFSYKSDQLERAGAPVRTAYLPPVVAHRPAYRWRAARRIPTPRSCCTISCSGRRRPSWPSLRPDPDQSQDRPPPAGHRQHRRPRLHGSRPDARPGRSLDAALE